MTERRLKVFVFIESDICTRHFVFSGVLRDLVERHDVTFIYPPATWRRTRLDPADLPLGAPFRRVDVPERRIYLWRRLFQVNQLLLRPGRDYAERRRCIRTLLGWKAALQLSAYGMPGAYQVFKASIASRLGKVPCSDLHRLLKDERPDVVVHPSTFDGYYINDLLAEARTLGIPSVLVMNSWDNPSIKQTMAGWPDWTVVWGDQTAGHCRRYMGLPDDRVLRLGAAQFDVFRAQPSLDRAAFCAEHGIDPAKRILMYAGSSKGSDEYSHLRLLEAAVASGALEGVAVLYRPHPWGDCGKDGGRIAAESWRHVAIEASMRAYVQRVAAGDRRMFVEASYVRTHDVLANVDAVISPLSTIIIEAALHGKPPLCFLPLDQEKRGSLFETFAGLVHFEEIFSSPTFRRITSTADLVDASCKLIALAADQSYLDTLAEELRHFVAGSQKPYGEALADSIERCWREGVSR